MHINRVIKYIFLFLVFVVVTTTSKYSHASTTFNPDINSDGTVDIFDYNLLLGGRNNPYTRSDYDQLIAKFGETVSAISVTPITLPTPTPDITYDPNHINTGVIYFSGSTGESTHQRNELEGLLAFDKYKQAWPYFTIVRSSTAIDIHEDSQAVVDQEIELASKAGLDYFAFLGSEYGLKKYLHSPNKNKIKFAYMGSASEVIGSANYEEILSYTQDTQYLLVTKNRRPIIFIFDPERYVNKFPFETAKNNFQNFISKFSNSTGKKPILVATSTSLSALQLDNLGFEDVSFYLTGTGDKGISYDDLTKIAVSEWDLALKRGESNKIGVIPTAMTGFDPRPKGLNPLQHGFGSDPAWAQQGTPIQISNHVKSAIEWTKNHPENTPTKTVLIYAWNEFAEGGWLTPTINGNDKNQRLNEISKILNGHQMTVPTSPYVSSLPLPHPTGTLVFSFPPSNSTVQGTEIIIKGTSPTAARITFEFAKKIFLINGKTENLENNPFSIKFPAPPNGKYVIKATSPDATSATLINITVKN